MSWVVALSVVASFGVYAPGWLYREIAANWDDALRDPAASPVGENGKLVVDRVSGQHHVCPLIPESKWQR